MLRERVVAEHRGRRRHRPFGTDDEGSGDQDLGAVGHHRAVRGGDPGPAEIADRSGAVGADDQAVTVELAVCHPELVQGSTARQIPSTRSSLTSCCPYDPKPRPVLSVTSNASRWVAMPAATIGRTETPARSASNVTNASCSTCRRRLNPRLGRSPRFHREPQSEARNCPSHASRPYTLTRWSAHNVRHHGTGSKTFRHPVVGRTHPGLRGSGNGG